MTSAQSQPSLRWVDEELRKQKEMLAELRDLVQNQTVTIEDQAGRIRELQERLTANQAEMHRIGQIEESLQQTKSGVTILLHDFREEQRKARAQAEEARQLERKADITALNRLSQKVDSLSRIEKQIEPLNTEDRRLREAHLKLQETIDDLAKQGASQDERTTLLDTQYQRDRERVARLLVDLDELREQHSQHATRLSFLEEWGEKGATLVTELQAIRAELQGDQENLQEVQRQAELRRQKQIAEWARKMETLSREMETWSDRMRRFGDQYEKSRKLSRELKELAKQLRYEQEQMRELQSIAEEQQRRELREWQGENEKRWNQHLDLWHFHLDKQAKLDLEQTARIDELAMLIQKDRQAMKRLGDRVEQNREQARVAVAQVWHRLKEVSASLIQSWEEFVSEIPEEGDTKLPAVPSANTDVD